MFQTTINNILLKISIIVLLFISVFYVVYSVRTGVAQVIYNQAKYGSRAEVFSCSDILDQCRKAQQLYSYNYRLMAWGAETAFERSQSTSGSDKVDFINLAETLCDRGLSLNRDMMPLPYIKMQLLCLRSLKDGILFWEQYVERDYWNSYNHAVLSTLYAADGKFGKAMQSLQFIKGTEDFTEANNIVQNYWDADSAMPSSFR